MTEETLSERMDRLEKLLAEKAKGRVRFPKLGLGKKKKGYCLVEVLRSNGMTKIYRLPIEDNVIRVPSINPGEIGTWHEAGADNIFFYKKYPKVIVPEWDMKPISKKELMEKAKTEGTMTFPEKYIFSRMKKDLIMPKKSIGFGKVMLIILILGGLLIAANHFGLFG